MKTFLYTRPHFLLEPLGGRCVYGKGSQHQSWGSLAWFNVTFPCQPKKSLMINRSAGSEVSTVEKVYCKGVSNIISRFYSNQTAATPDSSHVISWFWSVIDGQVGCGSCLIGMNICSHAEPLGIRPDGNRAFDGNANHSIAWWWWETISYSFREMFSFKMAVCSFTQGSC